MVVAELGEVAKLYEVEGCFSDCRHSEQEVVEDDDYMKQAGASGSVMGTADTGGTRLDGHNGPSAVAEVRIEWAAAHSGP